MLWFFDNFCIYTSKLNTDFLNFKQFLTKFRENKQMPFPWQRVGIEVKYRTWVVVGVRGPIYVKMSKIYFWPLSIIIMGLMKSLLSGSLNYSNSFITHTRKLIYVSSGVATCKQRWSEIQIPIVSDMRFISNISNFRIFYYLETIMLKVIGKKIFLLP